MRGIAAAFLIAACSPCSASAQAQSTADPLAGRVDSLFAGLNRAPQPGLALAVVRDGRVVLRRGYGLADIENRVPIEPATVFDLASVSKQFTGLAVAMLATEGRIGLNDDIRKYIPELPDFGHTITISHLLHHTSGIRDWPGTLSVGGASFADTISLARILSMAYHQRGLNFAPGDEHLYSNTGYNLLAELVQRVTRRPFRAWTDERLFRPLGMTSTHARDNLAEAIPNRAFGYERAADGTYHLTPNNLTALGSSSVFSTVDDMARWMINFGDARVGGRAAMQLMRTPGRLNDGAEVPYAFGILNGSYRGLPMFTHSGSWASFDTFLAYLPDQRFGVVVLANSGSVNAQNAVIQITNIYLERELARASSPAPATPAAAAPPPAPSIAMLDEYAGFYRLGPGWYVRIRREGALLTAQATHEQAVPMSARSDSVFWVESYGAEMTFHRAREGVEVWLEYRDIRAPKLNEPAAYQGRLQEYAGVYESRELGTSYVVAVRNGVLEMRHPRHGTIPLTRLWGDDFGSDAWFLASVAFHRNRAGRVSGFLVNGDRRSRDILFTRRR